MPTQVDLPRQTIVEFCQKWNIVRLDLFGSVLRDDFSSASDIDFLVGFAPESHWSLFDLVTMETELSAIVGRRVDLVVRETVEQSTNWIRKNAILSSAELYYAA